MVVVVVVVLVLLLHRYMFGHVQGGAKADGSLSEGNAHKVPNRH